MANSIYLATVGTLQTARVDFVEDATSVSHTASVPIPAGSVIQGIFVLPRVAWGDASAALDVGDTADPNGYVAAGLLSYIDAELFATWDVTDFKDDGVGKLGAYYLAPDDPTIIGPSVNNFGWNYVAGSNLIITVNVATPSATTGRTTVVVYYSVPANMPIVSA